MINKSKLNALEYDDVLLLPQHSNINSRNDVDLFSLKTNSIPVFSAPMKNISEVDLVIELDRLGGIGILHRFFKYEQEKYDAVEKISEHGNNWGVSVGLRDWNKELNYVEYSANKKCKYVIIDVASGYLAKTIFAVKELYDFRKNNGFDFKIISGNVIDATGCYELIRAGSDGVRVGIGGGGQCLTSKHIGIGCPSVTVAIDCSRIKRMFPNAIIIADGGISNSGKALKALCFGCDAIMIGSLFGRAQETNNNGVIFGMSSFKLQEQMNKTKKSNEGIVSIIPKEEIKPLEDIWNEFTFGLKSGLSYLGINNINNIKDAEIEYISRKEE